MSVFTGNFRCPVTYRIFTPTSVIVAIQTTGNVYSMEAVDELNLKRNHMKDLLSDKPFQRKDIITLQDPTNLDKFNIEKFYHVQFDLKTKTEIEEEKREMQTPKYYLNKINNEAREALSQLEKQYVSKVVISLPNHVTSFFTVLNFRKMPRRKNRRQTRLTPHIILKGRLPLV
jgi:peptidyl-prolyl cis-trans isomerase-like protein 2